MSDAERGASRDVKALYDTVAEPMLAWPNCSVPDCQFKTCLSLNSDKCYPHTTGDFSQVEHYLRPIKVIIMTDRERHELAAEGSCDEPIQERGPQMIDRLVAAFVLDGAMGWVGYSVFLKHGDPWGLFFLGAAVGMFAKNVEREL
jgi:hypothetical protein